jgi:delta24-sterol reductase
VYRVFLFWYTPCMKDHVLRSQIVSEQVKKFYDQKKPARIYRGGTHSTRPLKFKKDEIINVSKLNYVIEVNSLEKYVVVEPNVSMRELVNATLHHGLIPPVVMEFPEITVGGAIQGGAGESSSFRQGLFHDICLEYEIILGNGEIITASKDINPDLYFATAGSYGSLGVITLIRLRLIPAKKFVELTYLKTDSFEHTVKLIEDSKEKDIDFLDGILFSKDKAVMMLGKMTDEKKASVKTFSRSRDEWFYLHVERELQCRNEYTENIPLKEYLFRYDRGAFWMGSFSFDVFKVPFNKMTRHIFNIFLNTKTLYRSLHAAGFAQEYIIQDFCIPTHEALNFLNFSEEKMAIYPIWLCPLKTDTRSLLSSNYLNSPSALNIGIYGTPKNVENLISLNKTLEGAAQEHGGRKWLYAHTYYGREEFWSIYNWTWYSDIRNKYLASNTFPDIYEKVHVKEVVKGSIGKGFFNFFLSPFRLRS